MSAMPIALSSSRGRQMVTRSKAEIDQILYSWWNNARGKNEAVLAKLSALIYLLSPLMGQGIFRSPATRSELASRSASGLTQPLGEVP